MWIYLCVLMREFFFGNIILYNFLLFFHWILFIELERTFFIVSFWYVEFEKSCVHVKIFIKCFNLHILITCYVINDATCRLSSMTRHQNVQIETIYESSLHLHYFFRIHLSNRYIWKSSLLFYDKTPFWKTTKEITMYTTSWLEATII